MRIFLTGATGFIGTAIVPELIKGGHTVVGLARSEQAARSLQEAGAHVQLGHLEDLDSLRAGAAASDGVIHAGFIHDFTRFAQVCEVDRHAIIALGEALVGTDKRMVVTSGVGLLPQDLPQGTLATEADAASAHVPRIASEQAADAVAAMGVQVSVLRLPPSVHGNGDRGFVPMLIDFARQKGLSAYVEEGTNYWAAVHQLDAARLFRLALESNAPAGTRYHGVAEEGIPFREIAEVIGRGLGLPVVSLSAAEAQAHFAHFYHFATMKARASAKETIRALNWHPTQPGLIADVETGGYFHQTSN